MAAKGGDDCLGYTPCLRGGQNEMGKRKLLWVSAGLTLLAPAVVGAQVTFSTSERLESKMNPLAATAPPTGSVGDDGAEPAVITGRARHDIWRRAL